MDSKSLTVLEWPQLTEALAALAQTPWGHEKAAALAPETTLDAVTRLLDETVEARRFAGENGPSFGGVGELRPALQRAKLGATLDGMALLGIGRLLGVAKSLKAPLHEQRDSYPALWAWAEALSPLPELARRIASVLDEAGQVKDDASPELASLRRALSGAQATLRTKLQRLVQTHAASLQDAVFTVRGDRYVLPVRADAKGSVPGLVHDASATGQTLYIEPLAVVELNNAMREAQAKERAEVERLLSELSEAVGFQHESLGWTLEICADLDAIFARARLADRLGGERPRLTDRQVSRWRRARHPLLALKEGLPVVPLDAEIAGPDAQVLLITGPNTGGKTVALKTVGLCTLMTQAGLLPPADASSLTGLVDSVYADIGDEQSLAQSLSTFSGHLKNLIRIEGEATAKSLVLLDELGAGTDPEEGAAIARALLETLLERGSRVLATTHYGELKLLHYERRGVRNAAVEFDLETLSPTYRLLMGVSGQSNAVAIAERLGLPGHVLSRARDLLSSRQTDVAQLLEQVEVDRHAAHEARVKAEAARERAERYKADYEEKVRRWKEEREALETQAKTKVEQQVRSAQGEIAAVIREMQSAGTGQAATKATQKLQKVTKFAHAKPAKQGPPPPKQEEITVGKTVFVPKLNSSAKILTLPDKDGNVQVQAGILKLTVKIRELTLRNGAQLVDKLEKPKRTGPAYLPPAGPDSLSCDLRGLQAHEAVVEADQYLAKAYGASIGEVTLIHGVGTGALIRELRAWLKTNRIVKSFRPGGPGEGGDGVTVVAFR